MRTVEEVLEYCRDWIEHDDRNELYDSAGSFQLVIDFINSEPPCSHVQGIGMLVTSVGVGMSPFRAYLGHEWKADEMEFYKFKFCPECGEKLQ